MTDKIEKVSNEKAKDIISKRKPKGLFYTIDKGVFVAIDNTHSESYVEEFDTFEACEKWLLEKEDEITSV